MHVASTGGLPVSSVIWQSSSGAWALTAACKLTFRLEPGAAQVADQQEAVNEDDNYWNDDPSRSLVAPCDLAPFKPRADVIVVGHAFAPDRRPARSIFVRVCVGEVDKSVEVCCDRTFDPSGQMREGAPFIKMPLRYERAAGGPESWNPVGMSFNTAPDAYGRVPIPNLQPPGTFVQWRGDSFIPIGLGPIAPHWPGRTERLYHHARHWSHRDWPKRPLPADIDIGYFNVAPRDQQTDYLRPDERLVLENLHPEHARLATSLPGFSPSALVERASGHREQMLVVADTLWIDTDRGVCTVTWRGRIGLVHPREEGRVLLWVEGLDLQRRGSLPSLSPDSLMRPAVSADATATLIASVESPSRPALPFETSPWRVSPMAVATHEPKAGGEPDEAGQTVSLSPFAASAFATLPFATAPEPTPRSNAIPQVRYAEPEPSRPLSPPPVRCAVVQQDDSNADAAEPPAPPPMIGPLARPEMELQPKEAEPAPEVEKPAAAPPPAAKEPELSMDEYPIERCARIAVSLACRPKDAAQILEENTLSEKGWGVVKNHWLDAIRDELGRGKNVLLKRYDEAYVKQVEAERGPIGVDEYARLSVAAERGRVGEVIAEMRLPTGAPMRIERVWMERTARNTLLGEQVRATVDAQRTA